MTMKPIHVATINGHPVRFFKTPNNDGKPDFAWHSSEDLMWAANIKPAMINRFMRCCKADYGDFYRTVATPDGLVTIAPHFIAQAFTTAMVEVGHVPASFVYEYQSAGFFGSSVPFLTTPKDIRYDHEAYPRRHHQRPPRPVLQNTEQ